MPVANYWQETEEVSYALTFAILGLVPPPWKHPGAGRAQALPCTAQPVLQAAGAGLSASLIGINCLQDFVLQNHFARGE